MHPGQHGLRRGFTLLEAVLALSVLASILVVTLQLRAQSITTSRSISAHQRLQRDTDAILDSLEASTLDLPTVDDQSQVRTWTGEHLGAVFTLTATPVLVTNPLHGADGTPRTDQIMMFRYELAYREQTVTFLGAH